MSKTMKPVDQIKSAERREISVDRIYKKGLGKLRRAFQKGRQKRSEGFRRWKYVDEWV